MYQIIINAIKSIGAKSLLKICLCLLCFLCGYYFCSMRYSLKIEEYKNKSEKEKNELLIEISKIEQYQRDKISQIEKENIELTENIKAEYENTIANMRNDYILRDSVPKCSDNSGNSNDLPAKTSNTAKIRCYSESELYRKIERSLAIASECDKVINDYNTLLKICKL